MKINGCTIAGFVFAVVALFAGGDFGIMMVLVGFCLSIIGFARIKSGSSAGEKLSLASFIMLGIEIIWLIANS